MRFALRIQGRGDLCSGNTRPICIATQVPCVHVLLHKTQCVDSPSPSTPILQVSASSSNFYTISVSLTGLWKTVGLGRARDCGDSKTGGSSWGSDWFSFTNGTNKSAPATRASLDSILSHRNYSESLEDSILDKVIAQRGSGLVRDCRSCVTTCRVLFLGSSKRRPACMGQ